MISTIYCCVSFCTPNKSKVCHPISIHNIKRLCKRKFRILFKNTSVGNRLINVYSFWLVSLNITLIIMSIPNLINPGPQNSTKHSKTASTNIKNLKILYQNTSGFVSLKDNAKCPKLFTAKVLDFQGYIFSEKPDVVILNETWLNSQILDSELFPNNSYKVFRRDRSHISHPRDENNFKKFRVGEVECSLLSAQISMQHVNCIK